MRIIVFDGRYSAIIITFARFLNSQKIKTSQILPDYSRPYYAIYHSLGSLILMCKFTYLFGLMLVERRRRWAVIETTLGRCPVFTVCFVYLSVDHDTLALCWGKDTRTPWLGRCSTQRRWFSVDSTFGQSFVFVQSDNGILSTRAFV